MSTRDRNGTRTGLAVVTVGVTLAATAFSGKLAAAPHAASAPDPTVRHLKPSKQFKVPLTFEVNQGQADPKVQFLAHSQGYSAYATADSLLLEVLDKKSQHLTHEKGGRVAAQHGGRLWMRFAGGNAHPEITPEAKLPTRVNYLFGSDKSKWHSNIQTYAKVRYHNVYPGVDAVCYGNARELEYDLNVAPGADPSRIHLQFGGSQPLRLDAQGNLILTTAVGELIEKKPTVFQKVDGVRKPVAGEYVLAANKQSVSFKLGAYDHSQPLVIDPELIGPVFSDIMGGGSADTAVSITTDGLGNAYVLGNTASDNSNTNKPPFPVTYGNNGTVGSPATTVATTAAFSTTPDNLFISKFSSAGALLYSTYFGASANTEVAGSIVVDNSQEVVICCSTQSLGCSASTAYPTSSGAFDREGGISWDGALTKFNAAGSSILYSTYIPGRDDDRATDLVVNNTGTIAWVTGRTKSTNFLNTTGAVTLHGFQTALSAGYDAYVAVFNMSNTIGAHAVHTSCFGSNGKVDNIDDLIYGSYLGGSGAEGAGGASGPGQSTIVDQSMGIAIDTPAADLTQVAGVYTNLGKVYIAGDTFSDNFPTSSGAYQTTHLGSNGTQHAFVAKFDPSLTGSSSRVYSTYLSGGGADVALGVAADSSGNTYVTGYTSSGNGATAKFPTTASAVFPNYRGGTYDAFVTKLNPTGTGLIYSTYLGGNGTDIGCQIRSDGGGNAYVIGASNTTVSGSTSTDFPQAQNYFPAPPAAPTPANTVQVGYGGNTDFFITKLRPDGSGPNFSTYLGGTAYDYGTGIALDAAGNAYVCGYTSSAGFPTFNTFNYTTTTSPSNSYSGASFNGGTQDAVIAKFVLNDPPTITSISNINGNCTGPGGANESFTVTVTDSNADFLTVTLTNSTTNTLLDTKTVTNGTITPASPQYIVNPTNGTVTLMGNFPVGMSTAVVAVTDGLATVTTSATVTISDMNAPTFGSFTNPLTGTVPGGTSSLDACHYGLNVTPPTASDICSASDPVTGVVTYNGPVSGFTYPTSATTGYPNGNTIPAAGGLFQFYAGTSTITWTATNPSGLTSMTTQTVIISDNTPPTWLTPVLTSANPAVFPEVDVTEQSAGAGATVALVGVGAPDGVSGPTAQDSCDSVPTIYGFRDNPGLSDSGNPVDLNGTYPSGRSVITWLAIDQFFNITLAYQVVCVAPTGQSIQAMFPSAAGTQGWTSSSTSLSNTASGGLGSITGSNTTAGAAWNFLSGSGKNQAGSTVSFAGNQSWSYGGTLTLMLAIGSGSAGSTVTSQQMVSITGSGTTAAIYAPIGAPGTIPTLYTLNLSTSHGWTTDAAGNTPATAAQIQNVLTNLTQITIPGEWTTGNPSKTVLYDVTLVGP